MNIIFYFIFMEEGIQSSKVKISEVPIRLTQTYFYKRGLRVLKIKRAQNEIQLQSLNPAFTTSKSHYLECPSKNVLVSFTRSELILNAIQKHSVRQETKWRTIGEIKFVLKNNK